MRRLLQQTGLAEKRITCEEALLGGFLFAKCHHMTADFVMVGERLDTLLRKASVQLQMERLHESPDAYKREVQEAIQQENSVAATYFDLGFSCYAVTLAFGTYPIPSSDAEARNAIASDRTLRKPGGWFLGALQDAGLSPDEVERFYLEKIVPWLYEEGLRRWVGHEDMAVMSDLRFMAARPDKDAAADSPRSRLRDASRTFCTKIPLVGEPLAILVFGREHK